jgi:hypothetical protein
MQQGTITFFLSKIFSLNKFRIIFTIFFLSSTFFLNAQVNTSSIWYDVNEGSIVVNQTRQTIPVAYRTLGLNISQLQDVLNQAPMEFSSEAANSRVKLELPLPTGEFATFKISESPIMEPALAAKYPELKTYIGQSLTQGVFNVRFDFTPSGFHAMMKTINGTIYIDPYSKDNTENYISYYKKDLYRSAEDFICGGPEVEFEIAEEIRNLVANGVGNRIGEQLRTYRLALAATGEYTAFHGGTVIAGMNAIVVAMNRVNQIYENEVSVRMVLVANNDTLVYTNSSTDPYTNNNGVTMLTQNQNNIDLLIGNANYDIGHVFSTGGGGVAGLGVVCRTGLKARGVTGLPQPIGDPFYVDYVAHEMGHQYGGNHSFNGSEGSCSGGNRNGPTAYEPGSGATIMAYAGICGTQNLQSNSDDYFHGISQDEIVAYTQLGSGSTCPVVTATGNNAPVVTVPSGGFSVPIGTPFSLTGSATDPNSDVLTYCWEEFDLGPAGHPNTPSSNAPIFRSFDPTSSSSRTFPRLSNILNNSQFIGELLPSYTRTLTFRLTARDNRVAGGGVGKSSNLSFSVTNTAGPFLVTSPNTNVSWPGLSTQTITWNVANTNAAPVNCSVVNILLSTDGGQTFPIVLASNTANDGTEDIFLPDNETTTARIKIEADDNIFFDLSNVNFSISEALPVELASFNHFVNSNSVTLNWITATEINNNGFEVQRAKVLENSSANDWTALSFVSGKGTTTETQFYSYSDAGLQAGEYLYRLKIIDNDGTFEYSSTINVKVEAPAVYSLSQNYPNPFNPSTLIQYQLPAKQFVTLKIYDALGVEVASLINEEKEAGIHQITYDASALTSGIYFYSLKSGNFIKTNKMLLVK